MSIRLEKTLAPAPATRRTQPTVLSVDPKGERIAYPSGKSIYLRSIDDPSDTIQYTSHLANTTVARFSPISIRDAYKVATGDEHGTVKVWEWLKGPPEEFKAAGKGDGDCDGEWRCGNGRINDIAFAPDGKRVITAGNGARAFNLDGGQAGKVIGHSRPITAIGIRPNRPDYRPLSVITVSEDKAVVFSGGGSVTFLGKVDGLHSKEIQGVAISPDGSKAITVGVDMRIQLFVYNDNEKKFEHSRTINEGKDGIGHIATILGVSWAPDSKRFVTASADLTVKIWDVEAGTVLRSWTFGEGSLKDFDHQQVGVVWTQNRSDDLIISLSFNGDLTYLKADSEQPIKVVQGQYHSISAMAVSGQTLFTGGGVDGKVFHWDVASGAATRVGGDPHTTKVLGLSCTVDKVYSIALNNKLRVMDIPTKTFTDVVDLPSDPRGVAAADGRGYVSLGEYIAIYENHNEVGRIAAPPRETFTAVAACGSWVAAGTSNFSIRLYKLDKSNEAKEVAEATKPTSAITALAFSKDGSRLAVGTNGGLIYAYDVKEDKLDFVTDRWSAHTARVSCLAWNDKGTHVVSGSLDTNIYVWSYDEPRDRAVKPNAHREGVNGVAWVADDKFASVGNDACVKMWDWSGGR